MRTFFMAITPEVVIYCALPSQKLPNTTVSLEWLILILKLWMPESAKHNGYSWFSKRESPRALYSVYLRSSKSKSAHYNEWSSVYNRKCPKVQNIYSVLIFLKQESPKALLGMYIPRSKTWMPKSEKRNGCSSFSKRTSPRSSSEFTPKKR